LGGHSFNGLSKVYGNGLLCLLYQHVEAKDVWPHERFEDNIKYLVPIGKIVLEIGKALVALATETDKIAETFARDKVISSAPSSGSLQFSGFADFEGEDREVGGEIGSEK